MFIRGSVEQLGMYLSFGTYNTIVIYFVKMWTVLTIFLTATVKDLK